MSDEPADRADAPPAGNAAKRARRSTTWAGLAFVGLLGVALLIAQITTYGGAPVNWIYNDLDAALGQARDSGRRVFLYLHAPGCTITENHDRALFTQRFARDRLARMVACRVELGPRNRLATRFGFDGGPLMLVLGPDGSELARLEGPVERLQFETYIHPSERR